MPAQLTAHSAGAPQAAEIAVVQIPRPDIEAVLLRSMAGGGTVADALDAMQERSHGEIMTGWFIEAAESGAEQLWAVWDGSAILAIAGTLIETTGTGERRARIRFCTGEDSERWWRAVIDEVAEWAKHHGCRRLCIFSRPGWSPRLRRVGFRVRHIEHDREL